MGTRRLAPGDVLLFRMRQGAVAKHLGVVSHTGDAPRFIHAYDRHGVIESPLSGPWAKRIVARFAFTAPAEGPNFPENSPPPTRTTARTGGITGKEVR